MKKKLGHFIFRWQSLVLAAILHVPASLHAADTASAGTVKAVVQRLGNAVLLDVSMSVPVPPQVAWEVLTDFDHMMSFVPELQASESQLQGPNTYLVKQKGKTRYGPFSFEVDSVRIVELHPFSRIDSRNVGGNLRKLNSVTTLTKAEHGVSVHYQAEVEADFWLPPLFGESAMRQSAEERFAAFAAEMRRRHQTKP